MQSLPERLKSFYEACSEQREHALEHLPDLFATDVHFRDPFRETQDIAALHELFVRMFKQYKLVAFSGFRIDGDEEAFTMTYLMHLKMAFGPTFTTPMASVVRSRDGKIIDLLDYYDFPSGLVSPLPAFAAGYRKLITRFFL